MCEYGTSKSCSCTQNIHADTRRSGNGDIDPRDEVRLISCFRFFFNVRAHCIVQCRYSEHDTIEVPARRMQQRETCTTYSIGDALAWWTIDRTAPQIRFSTLFIIATNGNSKFFEFRRGPARE